MQSLYEQYTVFYTLNFCLPLSFLLLAKKNYLQSQIIVSKICIIIFYLIFATNFFCSNFYAVVIIDSKNFFNILHLFILLVFTIYFLCANDIRQLGIGLGIFSIIISFISIHVNEEYLTDMSEDIKLFVLFSNSSMPSLFPHSVFLYQNREIVSKIFTFHKIHTERVYDPKDIISKKEECPVCLEIFSFDKEITKTICNHYFHNDCITETLKFTNTCPICRKVLRENMILPESQV
jgi:hypothetical protein